MVPLAPGAPTGVHPAGAAPVRSALVPVVLLATDADHLHEEVDAALGDDATTVQRVRSGREVLPAVKDLDPDLVVLDLQIGNMGGMAVCMSLRLEEGAGRLERRPVLMLLDRQADTFLARRADADGWLVKPLDAFRLGRAARALLDGGTWADGAPAGEGQPAVTQGAHPATEGAGAEVADELTEATTEADDTVAVDATDAEAAEA